MKLADGDAPLPPFRDIGHTEPRVLVELRDGGALLLRHPDKVGSHAPTLLSFLRRWAIERPDRLFLARRAPNGSWTGLTYAEMKAQADQLAQGLLDQGAEPGDTALILSGNSLEHAVMVLAAMTIGVAAAPLSPAYSTLSQDHAKLRSIAAKLDPRFIFVQDAAAFARAVDAIRGPRARVIAVENVASIPGAHDFARLCETPPGPGVEAAYAAVGEETIAKILFTSGSTGWPKGVINTHKMMCVNLAQGQVLWNRDADTPRDVLSWLPWNHTMAGNATFNGALSSGGTYYLDEGRPTSPGEFQRTLRNLAEVAPPAYGDVPLALAMLADGLEAEPALAERIFNRLESITYAGAALPEETCRRLQALSARVTGARIPILSGYGSTETAPGLLALHWPAEGSGYVGLPYPGVEVKLLPLAEQRYEIRVKGPNVTPGYFGEPELSQAAFDEEGFYRMGDAVRFVDPADPRKGLRFAGRIAEDFKLLTGTFVSAGHVRAQLVGALAPFVLDAVVVGEGRSELSALIWLNPAQAWAQVGQGSEGSIEELVRHPRLRSELSVRLAGYNKANPGSSTRISRLRILRTPPSVDANEITDKGYVNRQVALLRRAEDIEALFDPGQAENISEAEMAAV